jgi:hypothetical protein
MRHLLALVIVLSWAMAQTPPTIRGPAGWIPARWPGGPLELARRAGEKALPSDPAVREAIANWYDPATLNLLDGSPVNCLLATWGAGADAAIERQQQRLIKAYAVEAHKRGIAVLGVVYPGADPMKLVPATVDARLDGLVLDGEFPDGQAVVQNLRAALAAAKSRAIVIPIVQDATAWRAAKEPVPAVEGVSPSARNMADMGIRSAPSSEPWIESNIWLVRSFRLGPEWRPVWISHQPEGGSANEYARYVADSAVAGGRWIVALDDRLRAKLRGNDAGALATWRSISASLEFAERHAEWRSFAPYGRVGMVLDPTDEEISREYLKLLMRRQVPYRLITRSGLSPAALDGFRAVVATELDPPAEAERTVLKLFAQKGGVVVAGRSWGDAPKDDSYAEVALGKGRVAVYRDPDPASVARDMRDLLSQQEMGIVPFNVPPLITYASSDASGKRLLIQLLNYSGAPAEAITIRADGNFKSASWYVPGAAPSPVRVKSTEGHTDVFIPRLALWGGLLLE